MSDLAGDLIDAPPARWLSAAVGELYILTKKRSLVKIKTVINYAQQDFLDECERQLLADGQIRIAVLKARQIGISTIIEAIMFVLAMMFDDFQVLIVSHENDSAENILQMTRRYWRTYPFAGFHKEKYNGRKHLAWEVTESGMQIATAKNEDAGRSRTLHALHASEVAFWDDPETLMTGLRNSFPSYGTTAIFLESTANGVGNFFHSECMQAMRGTTEYAFKFYPWWQHPEYTAQYLPASMRDKYNILGELDEEEQQLVKQFDLGVDRLIWRRYAISNLCQNDVDKFHQEYPSSPHEAFISTGRNVFPLASLVNHYDGRKGKRGVLNRNPSTGRIEFFPHERGWLTIYQHPSSDRDWGIYICGGDPTHTTTGDNAVIQVVNRRTLEQVAVYRNKIDPINFGKHMQLVGHYYNDALLAPEKEGPGYATVGCIVGDNYPNVYQAQNVAKQPGHPQDTFGWSTNGATKHLAISHLLKAIGDPLTAAGDATYGLLIHDELTLMEMRDYVTTEDGRGYENSDGSEYDDGVMGLAIAMAVHNIEPPVPPYVERPAHEIRPDMRGKPVITDPRHTGPIIGEGGPVNLKPQPETAPTDDPGATIPPWEAWGATREE